MRRVGGGGNNSNRWFVKRDWIKSRVIWHVTRATHLLTGFPWKMTYLRLMYTPFQYGHRCIHPYQHNSARPNPYSNNNLWFLWLCREGPWYHHHTLWRVLHRPNCNARWNEDVMAWRVDTHAMNECSGCDIFWWRRRRRRNRTTLCVNTWNRIMMYSELVEKGFNFSEWKIVP